MKNINELAKEYDELCEKARSCAEEIGRWIVDACKPVVKDIKYSVGSIEYGTETISFYSKKRNVVEKFASDDTIRKNLVNFEKLIETIIPALEGHIEAPYGIFLTQEEADTISALITTKIVGGNISQRRRKSIKRTAGNKPKQEQTKMERTEKAKDNIHI